MCYQQYKSGEPICFLFTIFKDFKKIGTCSCRLLNADNFPENLVELLPASWISNKRLGTISPVLEISGLETLNGKNKGNGRLCLQALFHLSQKQNCAGRMVVRSKFGAAPFYEHCGFVGKNTGQDGIKYFDPTQENLSLLFKDLEQTNDFKFIPFETPRTRVTKNSVSDEELFHRMWLKSQNIRQ